MNAVDAAWAAGFFDGEGSIFLSRNTWTIRVDVAQVDPRPLQKLVDLFGSKVLGPYQPKTKNSKPYYRWAKCSAKAVEFMNTIRPYLVIKQDQMDRVLNEYKKKNIET